MRSGPETYCSSTSALAPRKEAMSMSSDLVERRRTGTLTPPAQWYVSTSSIDSLLWEACSARPGWEREEFVLMRIRYGSVYAWEIWEG